MELSLKTEQKQVLSHKMIQSAEILQMTAAGLEEYLNEQALENPVLELSEKRPEEFDRKELEKYQWICAHDEQNRYLYQKLESAEDDFPEWNIDTSGPETLKEHLWSQLVGQVRNPKQEEVLQFLLDCLDSKGYFKDGLDMVAERFGILEDQVLELLNMIQALEPSGVGARSLEECLCIQLERQGRLEPKLEECIRGHLEQIARNQLPQIAKEMKLPLETVKEFGSVIRELEPRPGARFSDVRQMVYVVPDVVVVKFQDHFDILLNESLYPDITLNQEYVSMCAKQEDQEVKQYLLDKIHQVEWIKQCVAQRNITLSRVVRAVLERQEEFLHRGPQHLKPLRMADIAQALEIHESTVSRAVRQKYLQCIWGIFPLSYFFARAAAGQKGEGGDGLEGPVKATASDVKRELAGLIRSEDKHKPHSDRVLAELLEEKGYPISRRTVTKYREELGIPGASGRKEY